ncbi:hypothetical protein F5148DRAFT_1186141 [Russula earlei]|uniref:Uncharacterized protein n=1 Tax=Russula earlei TaxID=71964 RepID=A0ACC0UF15_9AGAM|nr:hypothetical protein F5148DRAFT_1186141 [Russula earlei]
MSATTTAATALPKGKIKDDPTQSILLSHWWNFYSLVEQRRRPVVWTSSAILFAHESEPAIVGRAFPSSRQFRLQSPPIVISAPGSYEPPTILCVSPDENWLFAYFPGRQIPGVGGFWRAQQADSWDIVESVSFASGRGVVSTRWLGHAREWVVDSGRNTSRLPPLGPIVLASFPTLILITQNLQVQVCCVQSSAQQFRIATVSCSLEKYDEPRDMNVVPPNLDPHSEFESRYCTHATIGLGYNESAILVATRSRPNVLPFESSFVSLGLDEGPESSPYFHDVHLVESVDWESWAQESNIELCEVRLGFDGPRPLLTTSPLPPLRCDAHPLSSLVFCPGDPLQSTVAESNTAQIMQKMYLCLSLLDLGKCDDRAVLENRPYLGADSTIPRSELNVFGLVKRVHPHTNFSEWSSTKLASKTFSETLTFIVPHHRSPRANTIVAGSLSTQGPASYSKRSASTKVPSGSISVLKLPSLDTYPDWGSEPLLMGWSESSYGYPPVSVALSPNATLLCAISQSTTASLRLTIHTMPKKLPNDKSVVENARIPDFVSALLSAIRSKRTISDVARQLSLNSVSVQEVESILCEVLEALESHDYGLRDVWYHEYLGILLEVYRLKGERMPKKTDQEDFATRWKTMQDLCSVIACHNAFEDCMDGNGVGLEYSWPLIVLSIWFVDFLEELMRECVLLGDSREGLGEHVTDKQTVPSTHPIMLNLLYPDALAKLRVTVGNVKKLYGQLKSIDPNGENGATAKNVLLDTIDNSGINLEGLESVLTQISEKIEGTNAADVRRSLAASHPLPTVFPLLWRNAQMVSKSNAIQKSRLFIKSKEFVSEFGKARKSSEYVREERDVVTKGILLRHRPTRACVRCEGKSQQHEIILQEDGPVPGTIFSQWNVCRRRWLSRCICGGRWVRID